MVGHDNVVAVEGFQDGVDLAQLCRHGRHGSRQLARCGHQLASLPGDPEQVALAQDPGGVECSHLTEAVTCDRLGTDTEGIHEGQQGEARCADGGLGPLRGLQSGLVRRPLLVAEAGQGEDHLVDPLGGSEVQVGCPVPGAPGDIEGHGQVASHAQVLAALTGEEESDACGPAADSVAGAIGVGEGLVGLARDAVSCLLQAFCKLRLVAGDDGQAGGCVGLVGQRALPGDALKHPGLSRSPGKLPGPVGDCGTVGPGARHQLGSKATNPVRSGVLALVLLQRQVEVRATKAKGTHPGAAWVVAATDPRAGLGVDEKGRTFDVELLAGLVDLDGGREHLVVQGHDRLEETGGPGRGLGVSDLGLHAAQGAPGSRLGLLAVEGQREATELRGVAGLGAGSVRFDQLDGLGGEARMLVGTPQRSGLTFRNRGIDAL